MAVTMPDMTCEQVNDVLDAAIAAMSVDDLLHAVVTEMNCQYPRNALQNGMLQVNVTPGGVAVGHPEWYYPAGTLLTQTPAPTLGGALLVMLRALRIGELRPRSETAE